MFLYTTVILYYIYTTVDIRSWICEDKHLVVLILQLGAIKPFQKKRWWDNDVIKKSAKSTTNEWKQCRENSVNGTFLFVPLFNWGRLQSFHPSTLIWFVSPDELRVQWRISHIHACPGCLSPFPQPKSSIETFLLHLLSDFQCFHSKLGGWKHIIYIQWSWLSASQPHQQRSFLFCKCCTSASLSINVWTDVQCLTADCQAVSLALLIRI